jgi:hypothetical protein
MPQLAIVHGGEEIIPRLAGKILVVARWTYKLTWMGVL